VVALLGTFDIAAQMLTQPLDVIAGLPVGGIVGEGLLESYRGCEPLHCRPQLLTHCARGVPVRQVF
jgi:hypothetical protein